MTTPDSGCTVCGANVILKDGLCAACWVQKRAPYADDELVAYLREVVPKITYIGVGEDKSPPINRPKPESVTPAMRKAIEDAADEVLSVLEPGSVNGDIEAIITRHIEAAMKEKA